MFKSPYGWSARYAAAKERMASQEANAAKNAIRHAHRQEVEAKVDLAAKKITEAEYEGRMAQICADLKAVVPSGFHDETEKDDETAADAVRKAAEKASADDAAKEAAEKFAAEEAAKAAAEKAAAKKAADDAAKAKPKTSKK